MGESGYANSSWSASAGYSASMLTEDAKVASSSTRQLLPSSVNISAEYPAPPDHDSMNNPSFHLTANPFRSEATLWSSWSQAGETASGEVNLTLTQKGSHNFLS